MKKKKLKVVGRICGYPVIGNHACAADYRTGCVLEFENADNVAVNRYYYDKSNNVKSECIMQYTAEKMLYMKVSTRSKRQILQKIRNDVGESFAIRKDIEDLL